MVGVMKAKEKIIKEDTSLLIRRIESDKPSVDEYDTTNRKTISRFFKLLLQMMRRMNTAKKQTI